MISKQKVIDYKVYLESFSIRGCLKKSKFKIFNEKRGFA